MQCIQFLFTQDANLIRFFKYSRLLINMGSTIDLVKNKALISNVKDCILMNYLANGGSMIYNKIGNLNLLPNILAHYNPDSGANILSMAHITDTYRATMDSDVEDSITLHIGDNEYLKFSCYDKNLYYYDTNTKTKQTVAPYIYFLQ